MNPGALASKAVFLTTTLCRLLQARLRQARAASRHYATASLTSSGTLGVEPGANVIFPLMARKMEAQRWGRTSLSKVTLEVAAL